LSDKIALLCAGGTGGHLFPAEALAHELVSRGWKIHLATDERARRFAGNFPAVETYIIRSATLGGKNPLAIFNTLKALYLGYQQSRKLLKSLQPDVVVGFGGYPTLPPLFAATRKSFPTVIHEQNAVLGRANRMLAGRVNLVAVGFEQVAGKTDEKFLITGNPVRPIVLDVADIPYPERQPDAPFKLVIFGGSQGARFFSEVFPEALQQLEPRERALFEIIQQARPEDEAGLKDAYEKSGISAQISPFFENMPREISKAHLIVSRAGASTITELAVIGRPGLLVPYPGSLDGDQAWNAIAMERAGGAEVVVQSDLSPELLAQKLKTYLQEPKLLATAAKNAKKTGTPAAASKLADCIGKLGQ